MSHLQGKKLKRYNEIKLSFTEFKNHLYPEFIIKEKDLLLITNFYYDYVDNHLKKHISKDSKNHINRFKIFSGTELAILRFQPIKDKNKIEQSYLNAELASFVATSFFLKWCNLISKDTIDSISKLFKSKEIGYYRKKHIALLSKIDTEISYPVVELSHNWLLMYLLICKELEIEPSILTNLENIENGSSKIKATYNIR